MKKLLVIILLSQFGQAIASDKIAIQFRSRGLFDIGVQDHDRKGAKMYFRVEDFRAGFKANYKQFEIRADLGVSGSKVAFKDLYLSYNTPKSTITFGNCLEPFGMDMLISTYDLRFNQSASSIRAITSSRKAGITYHFHSDKIYAATGLYSDNDINKISATDFKQAYASTSRIAWRPIMNQRRLLHIGLAASFRTVDRAFQSVKLGSYGIASFPGENIASCEVSSAKNSIKTCVELLASHGRFTLQGEYLTQLVTRTTPAPNYMAHGGYATLCVTVKGSGYGYNSRYAVPERPSSASAIELTAGVSYLSLNSHRAEIYGGAHTSYSLGVNYYINKYIAAKLSSSYIHSDGNSNISYRRNYLSSQLRIQYIF